MKLFLSYRRDDTGDLALHLAEWLRKNKRVSELFIDIDEIRLGEPFDTAIENALRSCDAVLVLIGPDWLGARQQSNHYRINDEQDFVRREVRLALKSGKPVVPILRGSVTMPPTTKLPLDIEQLCMLQAFTVQPEDVPNSAKRLIHHLRTGSARSSAHINSEITLKQIGSAIIVGALTTFILALIHNLITNRSLSSTLGSDDRVWTTIAVVFLTGFISALVISIRRR